MRFRADSSWSQANPLRLRAVHADRRRAIDRDARGAVLAVQQLRAHEQPVHPRAVLRGVGDPVQHVAAEDVHGQHPHLLRGGGDGRRRELPRHDPGGHPPADEAGLAVVLIFVWLAGWNEFIIAQTLLRPENYPLSVELYNIATEGRFSTPWTRFAAFANLFALPVAVVYFAAQQLRRRRALVRSAGWRDRRVSTRFPSVLRSLVLVFTYSTYT